MGKFALHKNVKRKGNSAANVKITTAQKKPARLRKIAPVSADAGAAIVDSPKYLLVYTGAILALMYALKLVIQ
jgi:hypothetical protein